MATTIITSDVHLGSEHCDRDAFHAFLDSLPGDATLVLAGDTLDDPTSELPAPDRQLLERIYALSGRQRVLLVEGNHDSGWRPEVDTIVLQKAVVVDDTLGVCHGDSFDNLMTRHRWFIVVFKRLHRFRVRLGAAPVHVAQYAKHWPVLYRFLRRNVLLNALEFAREKGLSAVVCGHVHYPEHVCQNGIDYFNPGSWTEDRFHYVRVEHGKAELLEFQPGARKGLKPCEAT